MKKTIVALLLIMIVFIATTAIMSLTIINGSRFLKSFNIISVNNVNTHYEIKFEKVKAAKYYELIIYNSDNSIFYKDNINENDLAIDLDDIVYGNRYKIVIYAYDDFGNSIMVNNPYLFTYAEPTFSKDNKLVLSNDKDYVVKIKGDLSKKNYSIGLLDGKYTIIKESIKKNEYTIPKKYYTGIKQVLTLNLYDGNKVINTLDLYSNLSPVKDVKIIYPKNDDTINYEDLNFSYKGGENATNVNLEIYNDDVLLKSITINNKSLIISSDFFKKGRTYTLKVSAIYDNYKQFIKSDEVSFKVSNKDTLKPAYININPNYVKNGDKLVLYNPNNSGKIYYTIDGSIPDSNSTLYKDSIEVKDNMVIKAIIKDKNKNDSVISEFKININDKENYKVYISSNDNFKEIINKLSDLLSKKNITIYQNYEGDSANKRISDAKSKNVDLYLALYANQSEIDNNGIESWIYDVNDSSYSLANLIHNNLIKIYKDDDGDKGIKNAGSSLDEISLNTIPLKILINLGYENNENDQKWINDNKDLIAKTIANTIIEYFDLI